jgi:hypothetical protein
VRSQPACSKSQEIYNLNLPSIDYSYDEVQKTLRDDFLRAQSEYVNSNIVLRDVNFDVPILPAEAIDREVQISVNALQKVKVALKQDGIKSEIVVNQEPPFEFSLFFPPQDGKKGNGFVLEYINPLLHSELFLPKIYRSIKNATFRKEGIGIISLPDKYWNDSTCEFLKFKMGKRTWGYYTRKRQHHKFSVVEIENDHSIFENHIQGGPSLASGRKPTSYGLQCQEKIVMALAYKVSSGRDKVNEGKVPDINRIVSEKGVHVPRGASLLISEVMKIKGVPEVTTLADLRYTDGKLYMDCGFTKKRDNPVDFNYVNMESETRVKGMLQRTKVNAKRLEKEKWPLSIVEHSWGLMHGWYRIYGAQMILFEATLDSVSAAYEKPFEKSA